MESPMARGLKTGAVIAGVAFVAGWVYRQAFPKTHCPKCDSGKWNRLGGGLKQCHACGHKFFARLPASSPPSA
jgi:ribosomal protein L37AE/L43A